MMMKHNHIFLHQLIILFKMIILYNLGLKNCENLLKDYFNLDYLNITVNFLNYEIYKRIIIYNTDYSIIKWYYICSKENIYYDESLKEILECYETCKSYNGIEINNCISCYNNRILTSKNTYVDVYEECGAIIFLSSPSSIIHLGLPQNELLKQQFHQYLNFVKLVLKWFLSFF